MSNKVAKVEVVVEVVAEAMAKVLAAKDVGTTQIKEDLRKKERKLQPIKTS